MTIDLETADLSRLRARMETDMGTMTFRFYPDVAPKHVKNFAKLAMDGFYDGLAFHRIIKGFMIQGGCPNTREGAKGMPGTGGPGWRVEAEFNDRPHDRGVLSAARSQDPNSAGSQFFVMHGRSPHLDGQYTAYGELVDGEDVLDQIAGAETEFGGRENSTPKNRIGIQKVTIELVGTGEDAPGDVDGDGDMGGDDGDGGDE
jgi:peptidyl-prolyl cis-trans isomerase B (cyclophilin B)